MINLRQYAERMAKARPSRYEFWEKGDRWGVVEGDRDVLGQLQERIGYQGPAWAFIGPLIDELQVQAGDLVYDTWVSGLKRTCDTWLESAFAAVANYLEEA